MNENRIYKYSKIDKNLFENLKRNQIYLNNPFKFNDIYEGLYSYNISEELEREFLKFYYKQKYEEIKNDDKKNIV